MGSCASAPSDDGGAGAPPAGRSIEVKPKAEATASPAAGETNDAVELTEQKREGAKKEPSPLRSPPPPDVFPPAAAHPFGLPLLPEELRALCPPILDCAPLTEEEHMIWKERIVANPKEYINAAENLGDWNRRIVSQHIPSSHRVALWTSALGIDEVQLPHRYAEYLQQPSPDADSQISRDIYRTFSSHPFFTHKPIQRCIGRILHGWSLINPAVGYVQGHNYLAALLLMVTLDEELAFRCFVSFLAHPQHGMQEFYADGLKLLHLHCKHLERLLTQHEPALQKHLKKHHLDNPILWATPFYLTAFTHHLSLESCVYLFDFLLLANLSQAKLPALPQGKTAAVAPAGADQLSLSTSRIATCITQLTWSMLLETKSALLKESRTDLLFQRIQQLRVFEEEATRRKVFERALAR